MLLLLFMMSHVLLPGHCACTGHSPKSTVTEQGSDEVFVEEDDANKFLGRHLLFNRFDFEIFTPGNLERECVEEVCNYEEAREVFENIPETDAFWKKYTEAQAPPTGLDVTALLVGLIVAGVSIVFIGMLAWYFCHHTCKGNRAAGRSRGRSRRSNASVVIRRVEEISLHPVPPLSPGEENLGLPSYEQAIAKTGPHDAPPPPYPGSRPASIRR